MPDWPSFSLRDMDRIKKISEELILDPAYIFRNSIIETGQGMGESQNIIFTFLDCRYYARNTHKKVSQNVSGISSVNFLAGYSGRIFEAKLG